jgi:hypothetical protein
MVTKHTAPNVKVSAQNVNVATPNVKVSAQNVNVATPNVNVVHNNKQCDLCSRTFARRSYMLKHMNKCNGTANALECPYCRKTYASRSTKYEHLRVCKVKKAIGEIAAVIRETHINLDDIDTF